MSNGRLPVPPRPQHVPHALSGHGISREDEFYWMRDGNWQQVMQDPAVLQADIRTHLEEENAYCEAVMAPTDVLQETLFEEMKGRIKEDDSSVPASDGAFAYYSKYQTGGQHPVFCRRPVGSPDGYGEETLLDGDVLAGSHDGFFRIGTARHSPDHKLLAYSTDTQGSEYYTLRIKRLADDSLLPAQIENTMGGLTWTPDSSGFFYSRLDANHRPSSVWLHRLGTKPDDDRLIHQEQDPAFSASVYLTESREFLVLNVHDHMTSELSLIPAGTPDAAPRMIAPRRTEHEYSVTHHGSWLYILTNSGDAEDFRIMRAPVSNPNEANWKEVASHRKGRLITGMTVFQNFFVRLETENALPRIVISRIEPDGRLGETHIVAFEEEAYDLDLVPGYEFDTDILRFAYSSPTTPAQIFDYDMDKRTRVLRKTQEVPSGHNPSDYVTRRIFITAEGKSEIPVTLLYRKDTPLDGSAPMLLYGYGSYGISMDAAFSVIRLSLVDRGLIHATAHIRGGMEKGYHWYREGRRFEKKNTFTDFIAVARGLIGQGFTSQGRIVAEGRSAGGLLVGAVANMAPELFKGIIAGVPFVDVLTTICDADLPLTPPEWQEWGNPITDRQAFDYIASYSPYDNIEAKPYPHVLATAGLTDPRVTYWEPAKWIARLRERRSDGGLSLMRTYMEAGHAGAAGRFDRLRDYALTHAFALMVLGKAGS